MAHGLSVLEGGEPPKQRRIQHQLWPQTSPEAQLAEDLPRGPLQARKEEPRQVAGMPQVSLLSEGKDLSKK